MHCAATSTHALIYSEPASMSVLLRFNYSIVMRTTNCTYAAANVWCTQVFCKTNCLSTNCFASSEWFFGRCMDGTDGS